ncbi:hypothetical protein AVEN_231323-1 [Araneus ventricosus]|uniref:Major facilitator superfamily associated domain-containing protein n=1 Tax=Araneus ventricosus TaxID=182803 RepID=A0A4Y2CJD7_ARAVE|nr:hypothetical protein AVEN_231323-1 [Araneus ventricosus]
MDLDTSETVDEKCATFLEPHQPKKDVEKKWWHINKKIFRFKVHFFLLGGGLSTVLPFVAVFARNTLQLSATSFGAVMTFQQFFFVLTKPMIGYMTDYFNKLKLIIFLLAVAQGLFLFLLLLIPPLPKEPTGASSMPTEDLACNFCYNMNDFVKTEKVPINFDEDVNSSETHNVYLTQDRECYFLNHNSTVKSKNYSKIRVPKVCHANEQNKSTGIPTDMILAHNNTDLSFPADTTYLKTLLCNSSSFSNISCAFFINNCIICCDIVSDCYVVSDFHDRVQPPRTSKSFKNDFLTIQFWLFAILFVGVNACVNAIYTLSDTAVYESVQKHGGEFGQQRLFSCAGWGLGAVVGGLLTDYTDNYHANFTVYAIISLITLWNIHKLDFVKPNNSNNIIKDIGTTMKSAEFLCFEVGVLLMGVGLGFTWFYLIWFVTSIGGNRLVCGLVQTVQSFAGDVPFFFISGWVLRKIGYFNIMSLALFACAVRFLWYSHLHNPWLVLPMEWTHGMTYGLFYAAMASYAKKNAKPGTEATSQSVIFATFDGLGAGIGNIVAGIGFDYIGGRNMFFYTGIFFCCCSSISLFLTYNFQRRNEPIDTADT